MDKQKSMLEREKYGLGGTIVKKLGRYASKKLDEAQNITKDTPGRTSKDRGVVVGKKRTKAYENTAQIKGAAKGAIATSLLSAGASLSWEEENLKEPSKKQASSFEKAFSKAHNSGEETFMFKGTEYSTDVRKGKAGGGEMEDNSAVIRDLIKALKTAKSPKAEERVREQLSQFEGKEVVDVLKSIEVESGVSKEEVNRSLFAEGGSLLVPPEMALEEEESMIPSEEPVDTFTPEEQATASEEQLPDDEMEEDYLETVLGQSLDETEQEYLIGVLETDPMLSEIFDKVIMTASEFSGAGEVEGPGTGVSDSIPARLSDGEFVVTEEATSEIGADNLQSMMDDAERKASGGLAGYAQGGLLGDPYGMPMQEEDDAVEKSMLRANRMPSLMGNR